MRFKDVSAKRILGASRKVYAPTAVKGPEIGIVACVGAEEIVDE